jgi:hypothetical protein
MSDERGQAKSVPSGGAESDPREQLLKTARELADVLRRKLDSDVAVRKRERAANTLKRELFQLRAVYFSEACATVKDLEPEEVQAVAECALFDPEGITETEALILAIARHGMNLTQFIECEKSVREWLAQRTEAGGA